MPVMRGIVVAVLQFALGLVGPLLLERFLKEVPEQWWRIGGVCFVAAALMTAILSDPTYRWITFYNLHPILSTATIGGFTAVLVSAL